MKLPIEKPMLALATEPFDHPEYLFEIKWDGYRGMMYLDDKTEIISRNTVDISNVFPELLSINRSIITLPAILDGEIVVLKDGIPSFSELQARGRLVNSEKIKKAATRHPAIYVAFDVLYAGGELLTKQPLITRKEILSEIVEINKNIIISQYIREFGKEFFKKCVEQGLEGVVAKKIDSPYLPGKRSSYWKKIRNIQSAEFVIIGYESGKGVNLLKSLMIGRYNDGELVYQGKVGTGFSNKEQKELLELFEKLKISSPKLKVPKSELKSPIWIKPNLVCEVNYTEITPESRLRHPSYKGLRFDKSPQDCKI